MKSLFCRIAQRAMDPRKPSSGWLSNHVKSCEDCQGFRDRIGGVEAQLRSAPAPVDEAMCRDLKKQIKALDGKALPAMADPMRSGGRPWIVGLGLGAVAAMVVFVVSQLQWKDGDEGNEIAQAPPAPEKVEPPKEMDPREHLHSLALLLKQKELLQRDARKLGAHLRERVILFKTTE